MMMLGVFLRDAVSESDGLKITMLTVPPCFFCTCRLTTSGTTIARRIKYSFRKIVRCL